jgi:serine/threonine protein kinase
MSGTQFAMVSRWMSNGNINEFVKARGDVNRFELVGFGLSHIGVSSLSITGSSSQLGDVAEGLVHMHEQGMVHGDLKGVRPR